MHFEPVFVCCGNKQQTTTTTFAFGQKEWLSVAKEPQGGTDALTA